MTIDFHPRCPDDPVRAIRSFALPGLLVLLALTGCGGGGNDSPAPAPAPAPAPVNAAPRALAAIVANSGTPSLGGDVLLTGAGSADPEGAALTYAWTLVSLPTGSKASLSSAGAVASQFTPDVMGAYVVRLRTTDPAGAFAEQDLKVDVLNHAPVPVIDRSAATILAGKSADFSSALSYDADGDNVTHAWTLESKPADSAATVSDSGSVKVSFTPDRPGNYVLATKVSDGKYGVTARVTIRVLAQLSGVVSLSYAPLDARYSRSLDKLVTVSTNPDILQIVDPFSGIVKSVVLPGPHKSLTVSADGKIAAILHEGMLSVVDIGTAKLLNTWPTGGSQTEVALSDQGFAYLIGQTGGQWVDERALVLNTRDGTRTSTENNIGFGYMYGTMRGVYSQKKGKGFVMSSGLSPADITYFTVDQATGLVTKIGDSPYHGDYNMSAPLFLSANEELVFTAPGTYFETDTLKYAGKLALSGMLTSLSQSPSGETLAIATAMGSYPDYARNYPASYQRFTGPLMLAAADMPFPAINGQPSYGIAIFHSAADNHVALVQTGGAGSKTAGLKYHVVYR